jgi:uncharacterized membrane protein
MFHLVGMIHKEWVLMAMVVFLGILNSITIGVNPIHGLLDVQFHEG